MAQTDNGPATGTAVLTFNNQASVEFHASTATLSLEPIDAPILPVRLSTTQAASPVNAKIFTGGKMQIPA